MKENGNGTHKDWGRVLVATRLEKTVDNQFVLAWSNLISQGLRKGDAWMIVKDRTAHQAANEIARQLLKSPYDSVLFIDSDWDGGPTFLEELRSVPEGWEYDAFQAFYTRRGWPPEAIWFKYTELNDLMQCIVWKDDYTEEVALVGLHCTLIRRRVFEDMLELNNISEVDPEEFTWFYYPKDKNISEDAAFSRDATKLGFKLGATTAVKAGHIGRATTGWQTYQEYLQLSGAVTKWERYYHLVEMVADYTEQSYDAVIAKAMHGGRYPRERWQELQPETAEEARAFYSDPHNGYLYDLLAWNVSPLYGQITAGLKEYRGKKALVIGAGLGEEVEALRDKNAVDAFELSGVLGDFVSERFADANGVGTIAGERFHRDYTGYMLYDLIVAIDTLEHIHPDEFEETLDEILACLAPDGELYLHNNWGDRDKAPQHFDNSEAFEAWLEENGLAPSGAFTYKRFERETITG